jgi:hypothetical protein
LTRCTVNSNQTSRRPGRYSNQVPPNTSQKRCRSTQLARSSKCFAKGVETYFISKCRVTPVERDRVRPRVCRRVAPYFPTNSSHTYVSRHPFRVNNNTFIFHKAVYRRWERIQDDVRRIDYDSTCWRLHFNTT